MISMPQLLTLSPEIWGERTDCAAYVQRQAQSCTYLEAVFAGIVKRAPDSKELFDYLAGIHRRQYADLSPWLVSQLAPRTSSFYFEQLYGAFGLSPMDLPTPLTQEALLAVLLIHMASYLRGHDRYILLRERPQENDGRHKVWTLFAMDAATNARTVFKFVIGHFDAQEVHQTATAVMLAEDALMHRIWEHKGVPFELGGEGNLKRVILSAGPIPAKLDSVKIVTNKFKGGLAIKTAEALSLRADLQVEIVKWAGTEVNFSNPESGARIAITEVADIYDYAEYMHSHAADAYILAAAVANLVPVDPWQGKFPSHQYAVGEEFDIRFKIAPRIIDAVKRDHPRSTLIGYKLFDGDEPELLRAGWETLCHSRANVIFCNHPARAKLEKLAVMPDGTCQRLSFAEHVDFIERVIKLQWYKTELVPETFTLPLKAEMDAVLNAIGVEKSPYVLGTLALRDGDGFITTTRGKRGAGKYCRVSAVDHDGCVVKASQKATLNAPFIDCLFARYPDFAWILHGHREIAGVKTYPYKFSGTLEETRLAASLQEDETVFNVENHGYYALFRSLDAVKAWLHG